MASSENQIPPRPWKIHNTGSAFVVRDASGRGIAYVYYRADDALQDLYLRKTEARAMAVRIARLSTAEGDDSSAT